MRKAFMPVFSWRHIDPHEFTVTPGKVNLALLMNAFYHLK